MSTEAADFPCCEGSKPCEICKPAMLGWTRDTNAPAREKIDRATPLRMPPEGTWMRGGWAPIHVFPRQRVRHEEVPLLHAMLHTSVGVGHGPRHPEFSIFPWDEGCGWAVYAWDVEHLGKMLEPRVVRIGRSEVAVRLGEVARMKLPTMPTSRQRLSIQTITPVTGRCAGLDFGFPSPPAMVESCSKTAERLGFDVSRKALGIHIRWQRTETKLVRSVGKIGERGPIPGWVGRVVVDAEPAAAWLLRCCAITGLGARVAYGFGAIEVREEKAR